MLQDSLDIMELEAHQSVKVDRHYQRICPIITLSIILTVISTTIIHYCIFNYIINHTVIEDKSVILNFDSLVSSQF